MKQLPRLPKIKGQPQSRIPGADRLHPKTRKMIEAMAARLGVSMNAVKNCILSHYFRVREEIRLEDL